MWEKHNLHLWNNIIASNLEEIQPSRCCQVTATSWSSMTDYVGSTSGPLVIRASRLTLVDEGNMLLVLLCFRPVYQNRRIMLVHSWQQQQECRHIKGQLECLCSLRQSVTGWVWQKNRFRSRNEHWCQSGKSDSLYISSKLHPVTAVNELKFSELQPWFTYDFVLKMWWELSCC